MTTFTVPTSVVNPTTGDTVYLPGHASFVASTDISDALLYWLTTNNGGIGSDGFCGMSGHTVQFRAEEYPLEYGTVWGLAQNQSSYTDRSGYVWPQGHPYPPFVPGERRLCSECQAVQKRESDRRRRARDKAIREGREIDASIAKRPFGGLR